MSVSAKRLSSTMLAAHATAVLALAVATIANAAGPARVLDTFTATTANMTPAGLDVRIQVLQWQEADARTEAVAALAAGADAVTPVGKLPTVGYVWPSGSPIGYSVKYAHRTPEAGGERITLVTDKRLGSYDFKGWSVAPPAVATEAPYSVIELRFDATGTGSGTLSLASEVLLDESTGTVEIKDPGSSPALLANVRREAPKP